MMNIEYLTQVRQNPKLKDFVNRGFSLEKIKEIEQIFNKGKEFPKAFREFLFLAGDFNNFGFDDIDGIIELQKYVKEDLEKTEQEVNDAFFAFSVYDAQYSVVFLDDAEDDPEVFIIDPYEAKEGGVLVRSNGWKFTDLVNERIRRVKNNIPA